MPEVKINVFIVPMQRSQLPNINYDEADVEKDPAFQRILSSISRAVKEAEARRKTRCDVSVEVERQKIRATAKLLERKGYAVFVQGVFV